MPWVGSTRGLFWLAFALASTASGQAVEAPAPAIGLPAPGGASVALPAPGVEPWRPLEFRSVERPSRYHAFERGGVRGVSATSECGASALLLPLRDIDLERTPRLGWRWRVERGLEIADERVRQGDDFAARVYLLFRFEPERASWLERGRHRLGRRLFGRDPPGHAINFVWTSRIEPKSTWDNPYSPASKMVALARGTDRSWRSEEVDVAAWHTRLFGRPPAPLMGVALMSDSDDSCQRTAADFAQFRFVGDPNP